MIKLPINEKELDVIIELMKSNGKTELYQKLWTYKINYLNKQNKENN